MRAQCWKVSLVPTWYKLGEIQDTKTISLLHYLSLSQKVWWHAKPLSSFCTKGHIWIQQKGEACLVGKHCFLFHLRQENEIIIELDNLPSLQVGKAFIFSERIKKTCAGRWINATWTVSGESLNLILHLLKDAHRITFCSLRSTSKMYVDIILKE